ncbi:uncharacterized protein LOC119163866 isoform X2 [Rhipicephalus microplus]|uniref:uncharacterized protein LOC119163866 isoform X2 n=1 Tax=Rhipicephalus microplus TaxID=6941 RepID=UPI003F6C65E8
MTKSTLALALFVSYTASSLATKGNATRESDTMETKAKLTWETAVSMKIEFSNGYIYVELTSGPVDYFYPESSFVLIHGSQDCLILGERSWKKGQKANCSMWAVKRYSKILMKICNATFYANCHDTRYLSECDKRANSNRW